MNSLEKYLNNSEKRVNILKNLVSYYNISVNMKKLLVTMHCKWMEIVRYVMWFSMNTLVKMSATALARTLHILAKNLAQEYLLQ